ncbi:MAG: sulfatase [Chloroflexi bacterium]|nr:sulfatase [Chloroflexota bacterium]
MNIVLVIFDTLRKDCLGAYGTDPPWGKVHTPHLDAFAQEALVFDRVYPEVLPTLPARRALYTGQRVYPLFDGDFQLKGDEVYAPGWGPVSENQTTLAEMLRDQGDYRTGLVSDLYHMFKPSKNFTRGFDQWTFLRGQELDPYRSGPDPTKEEIDYWLAPELQGATGNGVEFIRRCLRNMHGRLYEEDYFNARVMIEAARWLEENKDAGKFFLTVECFDPHEPWFVPEHYRRLYDDTDGREHVLSIYDDVDRFPPDLLHRAQANYSGLITMCDRWFGYLFQKLQTLRMLDDTVVIVMSDHGHSIGDGNYLGKRGYPSRAEVFEVVLMIRHPEGVGADRRSDLFLQHTDVSAQILEFAGIAPTQPLDGKPFWEAALTAEDLPDRDHITVAWGDAITVIDDHWWMNCKVDGSGPFLYDLSAESPFSTNNADENPEIVEALFAQGVADAGGEFPEYLLKQARGEVEAPKWNPLSPSL